jgi:hypothetical protein
MRNISDKSCRENQKKPFIFNKIFPKIVPFMRVGENMAEPDRAQMAI